MAILHVLNGDATRHGFEQTGLDGDIMVWREVLSEGPLEENITSASFWKNREAWISETFGEQPDRYQHKIIDELAKLTGQYDEINLWFEFDLHCQANMLGVMNYISQMTDLSGPAVYLICPDAYPGKENFMGMGELNANELEYLYDNIRVNLSEADFEIAAGAWAVFVKQDESALKKWLDGTPFFYSLHCLKPALEAQLKLLHKNKAGLNYIEQKLLDIFNYGIKTKPELYERFWETEKIYGMGDSQIDIYLNNLIQKGLISF